MNQHPQIDLEPPSPIRLISSGAFQYVQHSWGTAPVNVLCLVAYLFSSVYSQALSGAHNCSTFLFRFCVRQSVIDRAIVQDHRDSLLHTKIQQPQLLGSKCFFSRRSKWNDLLLILLLPLVIYKSNSLGNSIKMCHINGHDDDHICTQMSRTGDPQAICVWSSVEYFNSRNTERISRDRR